MSEPVLTTLTQFGAAGLIALLWLYERRHGASRDRQLEQAHQRLFKRERELDALVKVLQDNTRAITTLEQSQRRLISLLAELYPRAGKARRYPRPPQDDTL